MPSTSIQIPRGVHLLLAVTMALLAVAAMVVFWSAEAEACSPPPPPPPECHYGEIETQEIPDCIQIDHEIDSEHRNDVYSGTCNFVLDIENQCDTIAEASFFCEESLEDNCSENRAIASGEHREMTMVWVSNYTMESHVGVHIGLVGETETTNNGTEQPEDDDSEEGESNGADTENEQDETDNESADEDEESVDELEPAVTFEIRSEKVDQDFDGCPEMQPTGPLGCAGAGTTAAPGGRIALLALLMMVILQGRRQLKHHRMQRCNS